MQAVLCSSGCKQRRAAHAADLSAPTKHQHTSAELTLNSSLRLCIQVASEAPIAAAARGSAGSLPVRTRSRTPMQRRNTREPLVSIIPAAKRKLQSCIAIEMYTKSRATSAPREGAWPASWRRRLRSSQKGWHIGGTHAEAVQIQCVECTLYWRPPRAALTDNARCTALQSPVLDILQDCMPARQHYCCSDPHMGVMRPFASPFLVADIVFDKHLKRIYHVDNAVL